MMTNLRPSALMAKLDIKSAFRLCPVRPEGNFWVFTGKLRLSFGLHSSLYHIVCLADALYFVLTCNYVIELLTYYLDNFFTPRPAASDRCKTNADYHTGLQ